MKIRAIEPQVGIYWFLYKKACILQTYGGFQKIKQPFQSNKLMLIDLLIYYPPPLLNKITIVIGASGPTALVLIYIKIVYLRIWRTFSGRVTNSFDAIDCTERGSRMVSIVRMIHTVWKKRINNFIRTTSFLKSPTFDFVRVYNITYNNFTVTVSFNTNVLNSSVKGKKRGGDK